MRFANSLLACAGSAAAIVSAGLIFGLASPTPRASAAEPAPVQDAKYGTIKGRLVFGGAAPELPKIAGTENQEFCKDQKLVDRALDVNAKTKGIANGFAFIVKPSGKNADAEKALLEKNAHVQIDNKNCEFVPRSTALMKGQLVDFTSSDPVGHNSHYTGFTNNKNVALPPKGKTTEKLVSEARPIVLKCDIHPWMKGHMLVMDHPFFAVTDTDGSFEIKGVPAGTQNLVVWQEEVGYVTKNLAKGIPVTVKAGETTDVGEIMLDPSKIKKK